MKENKVSITVILVCILVSALALPSISSQNNKESSEMTVEKEVYYEQESDFRELPELPNITKEEFYSYFEAWSTHKYGTDENDDGVIGEEEVNYEFQTPKSWIIENTTGEFSLSENKVLFRLYGDEGIWATISEVDLSNVSAMNRVELAKYYNRKRSFLSSLKSELGSSDITKNMHILQKLSIFGTDVIYYCETYSVVKTPQGNYANIAYYQNNIKLGFVMDIYIPLEKLNQQTRLMAYTMGTSFISHDFGGE